MNIINIIAIDFAIIDIVEYYFDYYYHHLLLLILSITIVAATATATVVILYFLPLLATPVTHNLINDKPEKFGSNTGLSA